LVELFESYDDARTCERQKVKRYVEVLRYPCQTRGHPLPVFRVVLSKAVLTKRVKVWP